VKRWFTVNGKSLRGSEAYGANYSSLMKHALQEAIAVGPLEFWPTSYD
jgi:hypothetical protein